MTDNSAPKPWDKQPDEPPEWFNRFHIYLTLGPSRTLLAAYHEWSGSKGNHSSTVNKRSKEWRWKERALAFDQANRAEKAAFEAAREAEARERRIRQNDRIFQAVAAALDAADLENLSTIEDNAVIDPDYRRKLEENTGWKLRAHRYGDWEIAAGQFLDNFNYDLHVIEPFPIPSEWHCFMGMDYGYKHPTVFLLLAVDGDDNVYVLDEHVQNGWLPQQHAKEVHAMIERNGARRDVRNHIYAGADVFAQKSQFTISDTYLDEGLAFTPADTDRIQGAHELRYRLGNEDVGIPPSLFIFNRCRNLIECLPNLQNDPKNPEDVLKVDVNEEGIGGDDTYDALRYAVKTYSSGRLYFA